MGVDAGGIGAHDGHLVVAHEFGHRFAGLPGQLGEGRHAAVGMDRLAAFFGGLALPGEKAAARGIIFPLQEHRAVLAEHPHDQGVAEGIAVFHLIPDDGVLADGEGLARDGDLMRFRRLGQTVHDGRIAGLGLLPEQAGQNGPVGTMPFAGGGETAEKMRLDVIGAAQPVRRHFLDQRPEIVGDTKRRQGVGTRRSGADLEQIGQGRGDDAGRRTGIADIVGQSGKRAGGNPPGQRLAGREQAGTGGRQHGRFEKLATIHGLPLFVGDAATVRPSCG